ncbi:MAG: hypothetical protein AMXMBFR84_22240 [Candidatus Hydrogenedentota bacterium]
MNTPLIDYMKVGIVHFMAYPACMAGEGPVVETVRSLAEDPYFQVLEITRVTDPSNRRTIKTLAKDNGVDLYFGAQPILLGGALDLNHPESTERAKALEAVKAAIDQAAELEAKGVAVLSGKVYPDKQASMARLVESLTTLCAHAHMYGLPLVLEVFDQVPFGKNCLIGPTADAVAVSEQVRQDYPDFGIMLDLSHLPLQYESSADAIPAAGSHLIHAHIGNCAMDDPEHPAYGDNHPRFGAPGTRNDVPELTEYLRALMNAGYLVSGSPRVVSFEVKPMKGETPGEIIAESKQKLNAAWSQL